MLERGNVLCQGREGIGTGLATNQVSTHTPQQKAFISRSAIDHLIADLQQGAWRPKSFFLYCINYP